MGWLCHPRRPLPAGRAPVSIDTLLAVAAGAFAYHCYAKLKTIEDAISHEGHVIHLGALLDMADDEDADPTEEDKFGFVADSKNKRKSR